MPTPDRLVTVVFLVRDCVSLLPSSSAAKLRYAGGELLPDALPLFSSLLAVKPCSKMVFADHLDVVIGGICSEHWAACPPALSEAHMQCVSVARWGRCYVS